MARKSHVDDTTMAAQPPPFRRNDEGTNTDRYHENTVAAVVAAATHTHATHATNERTARAHATQRHNITMVD